MAARERLCDYFAVVGPKEADLENRVVQEAYSIGSLHRALEEAIVDICIISHPKDPIPFDDNYELLLKPDQAEETSINANTEGSNNKLQLAKHCYICFRRRKHNKTPSYITEVRLIRKGVDPLPEGFELIEKTVGGGSADLGKIDLSKGLTQHATYLAVKRAVVDEKAFRFSTPPMLLDLCLCSEKKGGGAPMDYTVLPRVLPKLGGAGEEMFLAYMHGPSAGLCDIPYEAHSLEWFPHENTYEDFPLPQNELPMFCFPQGISLKHQKRDNTPMPSYFSFVFTSIDGDRVHVGCLQFWELLPERVLRSLEAKQRILTVVGSFSPGGGGGGGGAGGVGGGGVGGGGGEWDSHDEESVTSSVEEEEEDGGVDAEGKPLPAGQHHHHHHHHHHQRCKSSATGGEQAVVVSPGGTSICIPATAGAATSTTISTTTTSSAPAPDRSSYGLFAPKCICIISHWPFYRALRSFLQQIYRISLSPAAVPLERYISYFTHYMPLPPPGQLQLNLHIDLGLTDRVENSSLTPITLRLPDTRSLPMMDLDYDAPFRCLSLENVLKIFVLLLMEERVLFISSSTSLLTEVTETILTLLFPFEWLSCYIPRLPNKLTEILDAPGSLLIGIYMEGTTDNWVPPQLSDPIFLVDLDHNRIIDAEGKQDYAVAMEEVPILEALREKLKGELDRAAITVKTAVQLRERDSAFELPAVPGALLEEVVKPKLSPDVVRDAFLVFMCELLGNYTRFFNSQDHSGEGEGGGNDAGSNGVFGAFDVTAFVASVDKTAKPLLDRVVLTQMFAALVQQRTDHSHGVDRLVFFETCVQELKERKEAEAALAAAIAAGGGGGLGGGGAGGVGSSSLASGAGGAGGKRGGRMDERNTSLKGSALAVRSPDGAGGVGGNNNTNNSNNINGGPPLLIHQAVASMVRREQLLLQQQQQQQQQAAVAAAAAVALSQSHLEALVVPSSSSSGSSSPRHLQSSASLLGLSSAVAAVPIGDGVFPTTVIVPGPSAEGCASCDQQQQQQQQQSPSSFSYTHFPISLNKEWMTIPSSALPPVLLEIISRRKKSIKKGNRMILARSVSECMKDWQTVGTHIGGARNKEIYLAMQIFGIYFMCLPSRVTYKGRPLKIIMQAMGILQFILDNQLERYMDEAMWRSLLVACGRCGHGQTRKIAIAIFGIMRRAGLTINALTYGQYTKALAEKDAAEFTPTAGEAIVTTSTTSTAASGTDGAGVGAGPLPPSNGSISSMAAAVARIGIDDSPWLEERGQAWYLATCEPPPPETLKSATVADSFKSLLARTKANGDKKKVAAAARERLLLQEGDAWTTELRDPKLSAHNTTVSSITMDSAGVIGMWVVCLCVNCEYMPLDEEIMTLRQDLLLVQAVDDHNNHLLLCPKCETPLMPRLYYDVKTFPNGGAACGHSSTGTSVSVSVGGGGGRGTGAPTSTSTAPPPLRQSSTTTTTTSVAAAPASAPTEKQQQTAPTSSTAGVAATALSSSARTGDEFFAAVVGTTDGDGNELSASTTAGVTALAAVPTEPSSLSPSSLSSDNDGAAPPSSSSSFALAAAPGSSSSAAMVERSASVSFSTAIMQQQHQQQQQQQPSLRGEISGLSLETTGGDHVDYLSPFTLRMRLEKLLLEHGEECLTREWARERQPDLYWNLVWFTTRLSIPFPFLLDSLDPILVAEAAAAAAATATPKSEKKKKKRAGDSTPSDTSLRGFMRRGLSRYDSTERLRQLYFHEIVVVGWEGQVVRNRCDKVEAMLKQRSFTPRTSAAAATAASASGMPPPAKSSSSVGAGGSAGVLQSLASTMNLGETLRSQLVGGGGGGHHAAITTTTTTTGGAGEAIGPLTVEQIFPNISAQELEAIDAVKKTLLTKGCPGLKDALHQFFTLKHKQGGWTSEATLGSAYRVFLKLAANFHIKKLHNIAPISNLMANPGLEHEYTTAVMKLGDRFLRDKTGKDEKQLLAELPKRDAIKFRSVFGQLY